MSKYEAIIWDLDGTLLDTLDDLRDSVNAALTQFGLPLRTRSEIRAFIGNGTKRLVELSVPDGLCQPHFDEIYDFFKSYYMKNSRNKTKPYEGVQELLNSLKACGYRMAIVSNKLDSVVKELAELFYGDAVETAIGASERTRRKPDPDMVYEALEILGVSNEKAVYIGDTEVDLLTAANSGLDCISVSWGFRDAPELVNSGAKVIAATPRELAEILK